MRFVPKSRQWRTAAHLVHRLFITKGWAFTDWQYVVCAFSLASWNKFFSFQQIFSHRRSIEIPMTYIYMNIHIYVYMCTCIHVCMYIFIYIHIHMYIYVHICIYTHICIYIYIYTYIYVYMYIYIYIYTYIWLCISIYLSIYIYIRPKHIDIYVCICTYMFIACIAKWWIRICKVHSSIYGWTLIWMAYMYVCT